ncbi:hypothetical protein [Vitreimonas sp.]|jgi:hypothetical protein|uniref:hypothetical protein n=1 Tax=Vitreimonas sp. TaxID=3069702 RepID=UPI002EDA73BD
MSQAVIDFCEGLKSTLLTLEDRLAKAKTNLETGAAGASSEAKKHIDEAAAQLAQFKTHAALMAQAIRADLPNQTAVAQEKLKDFGQEAQVALRHAVVFLAENTAEALQVGAKSAQRVAEHLRHETAVAVVEDQAKPPA